MQKKYRILTAKSIQALKDFQYNGVDHSYLYKYILSPAAGFFVDKVTPSWVAPNTITLSGFLFMIASYLLMDYHCPTLDDCSIDNPSVIKAKDFPSYNYIFAFHATAILIYQTLDNMDGKQARKTGSSSPLGLLFDHGLDACNSIIGTIGALCSLGLSARSENFVPIFIMTFCPMVAFYTSTWEEYYTHKLILPVFNGPSEGLLIGSLTSFITFFYGRKIWHQTFVYDAIIEALPSSVLESLSPYLPEENIYNYNVLATVTLICTIREILSKIIFVVKRHGFSTVKNLVPMSALMVLSKLIVSSDEELFRNNQKVCFLLVGAIFVEMVVGLMFSHMTKGEYKPFRNTLCPMFFLVSLAHNELPENILEQFLWIYLGGMVMYLALLTFVIIREMCDALGIFCFNITSPHPNTFASAKKKLFVSPTKKKE